MNTTSHSITRLLCVTVLLISKTVTAQSDKAATHTGASEKLYELLVERQLLSDELSPSHPSLKAVDKRIALLKKYIASEAEAKRRTQDQHAAEVQEVLDEALEEFSARRDDLQARLSSKTQKASHLALSAEGLREIIQQLAVRQIEERLKSLEARALMMVLEEQVKSGSSPEIEAHHRRLDLATKILAERQKQVERAKQLTEQGVISSNEMSAAEGQVLEARARLADLKAVDPRLETYRQIGDAATAQKVSEVLQDMLQEEIARVRDQIQGANERQELVEEIHILTDRVNDLKKRRLELQLSLISQEDAWQTQQLLEQAEAATEKTSPDE